MRSLIHKRLKPYTNILDFDYNCLELTMFIRTWFFEGFPLQLRANALHLNISHLNRNNNNNNKQNQQNTTTTRNYVRWPMGVLDVYCFVWHLNALFCLFLWTLTEFVVTKNFHNIVFFGYYFQNKKKSFTAKADFLFRAVNVVRNSQFSHLYSAEQKNGQTIEYSLHSIIMFFCVDIFKIFTNSFI